MKKILYITNVSDGVSSFSKAAVEAAHSLGYEFHLAGNFSEASKIKLSNDEKKYGIKIHNIELERKPYSFQNIKGFKQLTSIVREEKIDLIHCNTPTGGLLGRLVGKKCKVKYIIYQAHGFHFYKGAPIFNWLLYYPVERLLAHYTNIIITINQEDYERAKKFKLKENGEIIYIPGVGINLNEFNLNQVDNERERKAFGLYRDDFLCIAIGRLERNKNFDICIRAISKCDRKIHLLICGIGKDLDKLVSLSKKLNIENQVHFLGHRSDIPKLLQISNCFISMSQREGLPRVVMEAMASGLPCIVSNIRGNVDLIKNGQGGYVIPGDDYNSLAMSIDTLYKNQDICINMKNENLSNITNYDINIIISNFKHIYLYICK